MSTARKLLLYVIYFIIIIALGITIILAFTHHDSKKSPAASAPKSTRLEPKKTDQPKPTDRAPKSPATSESSSPSTVAAGESTRSAIASATAVPAVLANTGPGNLLLLFGLTTVVAAAGYRRHLISTRAK